MRFGICDTTYDVRYEISGMRYSVTAGTIRNETVTFLQNVSVSLRKSSSVSVSLHPGTRTLPGVTDSLRSCGLHLGKFPKTKNQKNHIYFTKHVHI